MADLFIGDLVETAISSAVTMRLGKVTYVKLGALAKFRIDNFVIDAGGTFDLEQGPMLIEHNSGGKVRKLAGALAVRPDCSARYEILCRPEQRRVWRVRRPGSRCGDRRRPDRHAWA
jgi:hypothetical protein